MINGLNEGQAVVTIYLGRNMVVNSGILNFKVNICTLTLAIGIYLTKSGALTDDHFKKLMDDLIRSINIQLDKY